MLCWEMFLFFKQKTRDDSAQPHLPDEQTEVFMQTQVYIYKSVYIHTYIYIYVYVCIIECHLPFLLTEFRKHDHI